MARSSFFSAFEKDLPKPGDLDVDLPKSTIVKLRRFELMVTGDPSRVRKLSTAANEVQRTIFSETNDGSVADVRITALMDKCCHSTGWSNSFQDAGAETTEWHCYQDETRFDLAFANSVTESTRRGKIDSILVIGDRFDNPWGSVQGSVKQLADLGTKIFGMHMGKDKQSFAAFQRLSDATGGVNTQLQSEKGIKEAVVLVVHHMFGRNLSLLPAPKDAGVLLLTHQLAAKPA